jgi:hypothetical protein
MLYSLAPILTLRNPFIRVERTIAKARNHKKITERSHIPVERSRKRKKIRRRRGILTKSLVKITGRSRIPVEKTIVKARNHKKITGRSHIPVERSRKRKKIRRRRGILTKSLVKITGRSRIPVERSRKHKRMGRRSGILVERTRKHRKIRRRSLVPTRKHKKITKRSRIPIERSRKRKKIRRRSLVPTRKHKKITKRSQIPIERSRKRRKIRKGGRVPTRKHKKITKRSQIPIERSRKGKIKSLRNSHLTKSLTTAGIVVAQVPTLVMCEIGIPVLREDCQSTCQPSTGCIPLGWTRQSTLSTSLARSSCNYLPIRSCRSSRSPRGIQCTADSLEACVSLGFHLV